MNRPENQLQLLLCDFLRLKYPGVYFRSDEAGRKRKIYEQAQHKRLQSHRGYPDLFVAQPMGKYSGLFLELKAKGVRITKKNGDYASEHIAEQYACIAALRARGYCADFAVGFDEAKEIIETYMSLKPGESFSKSTWSLMQAVDTETAKVF